jgi:hypothetical protein
MAKIPTTEFCPQCAAETPEAVMAKSGRVQTRVYQDLDTGKYECAKGHTVDLEPNERGEVPIQEDVTHFHPDNDTLRAPIASQDDTERVQEAQQGAVAVEEMPQQAFQAQVVPGSSRSLQGGALEVRMIIPEQFVKPLESFCEGSGKSVEEYLNEIWVQAWDNGWFL